MRQRQSFVLGAYTTIRQADAMTVRGSATRAWRFGWRLALYLFLEMLGASVLLLTVYGWLTSEGFLDSAFAAFFVTALLIPVLAVLAVVLAASWTSLAAVRRDRT